MTDYRLFDPDGLDVDQRVTRLEDAARHYAELVRDNDQLALGVNRLGDNTEALGTLLRTVSENAEKLTRVERKTETVAFVAEEKAATAHIERKLFLRRAKVIALSSIAFMLLAIVGGAWLTDKHFQECVLYGPDTAAQESWCNFTAPGHDHPQDITLEALLRAGGESQKQAVLAQREGCERTQTRLMAQVERERSLALVDAPETRAIHTLSANRLEKTLVDCDEVYPLPEPRFAPK